MTNEPENFLDAIELHLPLSSGMSENGSSPQAITASNVPVPVYCGNIEIFIEQLKFYFMAAHIGSSDYKSVLLSGIPADAFKLASSLFQPKKLIDETITFEALCEKLIHNEKPKKSVVIARMTFDGIEKRTNESISEYVIRLNDGAADCDFPEKCDNYRDERMKDRFISGLHHSSVLKIILKEKRTLTFDEIVTRAYDAEKIIDDTAEMSNPAQHQAAFVSNYHSEPNQQHRPPAVRCDNCGMLNHTSSQCRRKIFSASNTVTCSRCLKRGHYAKNCHARSPAQEAYTRTNNKTAASENYQRGAGLNPPAPQGP